PGGVFEGDRITATGHQRQAGVEQRGDLAAPGTGGDDDGIGLEAMEGGDQAPDSAAGRFEAPDLFLRKEFDAGGLQQTDKTPHQFIGIQVSVTFEEDGAKAVDAGMGFFRLQAFGVEEFDIEAQLVSLLYRMMRMSGCGLRLEDLEQTFMLV